MRRFGSALMALGAFVGVGTGLAVLTGVDVPGVGSWVVAVAVAKLGFIAAFALIAAGALLHRVAGPPGNVAVAEGLSPAREADGVLAPGAPPTSPVAQHDAVRDERGHTR